MGCLRAWPLWSCSVLPDFTPDLHGFFKQVAGALETQKHLIREVVVSCWGIGHPDVVAVGEGGSFISPGFGCLLEALGAYLPVLDGRAWNEVTSLPSACFNGLADILRTVEDLERWPQGLLDAHIGFDSRE